MNVIGLLQVQGVPIVVKILIEQVLHHHHPLVSAAKVFKVHLLHHVLIPASILLDTFLLRAGTIPCADDHAHLLPRPNAR